MSDQITELLKELLLLQRLSFMLQCERVLDSPDKKRAKFMLNAVSQGHIWALTWEYDGLLHTIPESTANEVGHILTMWRMLAGGYEKLSESDKQDVIAEAEPVGGKVKFPGFDGNLEAAHLVVSMFLVEEMGRFQELKGCELNSHWPCLDSYRRMLPVFHAKGMGGLSKAEIIEVLKAMRHPDAR